MLTTILEDPLYLQFAFAGCIALAILTLPLKDIISIGFYDISDFFVTAMIAFFITYGILVTNHTAVSIWLFVGIFFAIMVVIMLMNILVILPFKSRAENSNITSIHELEGKEAKVSIPITLNGTGEVIVSTGFSRINKMAKIYENTDGITDIPKNENVLVMDVSDNILYVLPYTNSIKTIGKPKPTWNEKQRK
ncbi:membrane integrity integral inner membrane protein [Carnobacterium inhibens]|uniref:Membrane integrity integral inner membrane protein n=1 Tax=Carnobacterium inhibens subsp. gilichinskyi TaxID=1266845 RepID=U5SBM3_9LACT|nr:membrane integrity integral inner membrane protein [Carnobacterium inhibens]AGY82625.1 membrane integrity integral inner membrane protein [Carnobacterium inhibens subsp. gilichinskyi]